MLQFNPKEGLIQPHSMHQEETPSEGFFLSWSLIWKNPVLEKLLEDFFFLPKKESREIIPHTFDGEIQKSQSVKMDGSRKATKKLYALFLHNILARNTVLPFFVFEKPRGNLGWEA